MTEPRPPIHPRDDDWPPIVDHWPDHAVDAASWAFLGEAYDAAQRARFRSACVRTRDDMRRALIAGTKARTQGEPG